MTLGKGGWTGDGSAYQLLGYLSMAQPEQRTQLRLRSCRCSASGGRATSLIVSFIQLFHSPLSLARKDIALPLGLSDLLFWGGCVFALSYSLRTQLPFFGSDQSCEAGMIPCVSCFPGSRH